MGLCAMRRRARRWSRTHSRLCRGAGSRCRGPGAPGGRADRATEDRLDGAAPQRPELPRPGPHQRRRRGAGVPNAMRLLDVYPLFVNRVAPFFVGKDARQLEPLALGALPARRQLQVPGAGPLGLRGGRRVRGPRPARARRRASRSATCSAASSGARSPSTAPAAPGATPPRRRSRT